MSRDELIGRLSREYAEAVGRLTQLQGEARLHGNVLMSLFGIVNQFSSGSPEAVCNLAGRDDFSIDTQRQLGSYPSREALNALLDNISLTAQRAHDLREELRRQGNPL